MTVSFYNFEMYKICERSRPLIFYSIYTFYIIGGTKLQYKFYVFYTIVTIVGCRNSPIMIKKCDTVYTVTNSNKLYQKEWFTCFCSYSTTNKQKKNFEILSGPCMTIFFFFSDQALDPGTGIPVKSIWD